MVQINPVMSYMGQSSVNKAKKEAINSSNQIKHSQISFTGKNVNQVAHLAPEGIGFFKGGGVGTVINDLAVKLPAFDPSKEHIFFTPLYNADNFVAENGQLYVKAVEKEIDGHKQWLINDLKDIDQFNGDVTKFKISEILDSSIEQVDASGKSIVKPTKLFEVELPPSAGVNTQKIKAYVSLTPGTGSMAQQYGYAYQNGSIFEHYSENARATIKMMSELEAKTNGTFSPQNLLVHDYHGSAALKFAQDQATGGSSLFKDMRYGMVVHNGGRGYHGLGSSPFAFFQSYATPEQTKKLISSQEYIDATKVMPQDGGKALEGLIKTIMPNMVDETDTLNPMNGPINLAKNGDGFASGMRGIATVSKPYPNDLIKNSEMSEGITKGLGELEKQGRFVGITNGLALPDEKSLVPDPLYSPHEKNPVKLLCKDGTELKPFTTFDPALAADATKADVIHSAKQNNKINFIERIVKRGEVVAPDGIKDWDPSMVVTGRTNRTAKIYSNMDTKTLENLTQNPDSHLVVNWGRGDFQKAIDEALMTVKKYAHSEGADKNSLFVFGGGLSNDAESKRVMELVNELVKDDTLKGRFAFIDGWCPAGAMSAAGDTAFFPSRFAPCELTPQEAHARGAATACPKTGGMAISTIADGEGVNGYLTQRGYYDISKDDILASTTYGEKFTKQLQKLIDSEKAKIEKANFVAKRTGQKLQSVVDTDILATVEKTEGYGNLIRKYRDEMMSDDYADLLKKAISQTPEELKAKMMNAINAKADWDNNLDLNGGKSALQRYNEFFWEGETPDISKARHIIDDNALNNLTDAKVLASSAQDAAKAAAEGAGKTVEQAAEGAAKGADAAANTAAETTKEVVKEATSFMGKAWDSIKKHKVVAVVAAAAALAGGSYLVYTNKKKSEFKVPNVVPATPTPQATQVAPVAQVQAAPAAQGAIAEKPMFSFSA